MKVRRALQRRSPPDRDVFEVGQYIMFWRNGKGVKDGNWNGPGRVIARKSSNVYWVTHLARLYRCAPEHLRHVSRREQDNCAQQDSQTPIDLPNHLGTGVFQFHDLTNHQVTDPTPQTEANLQTEEPTVPVTGNESPNEPLEETVEKPSEVQPDSDPDQGGNSSISVGEMINPVDVPIPDAPFSDANDSHESPSPLTPHSHHRQ